MHTPKLFFYDLETTGLDHKLHSIHQISGTIDMGTDRLTPFNLKLQPNPYAVIDDKALEIAGITKETLKTYTPFQEAYQEITRMLGQFVSKFDKHDKLFLVGYNNAKFDDVFFRAFFEQNNDNYFGSYFWATSIDVVSLATNRLAAIRPYMENFKLATVAKQLGIQVDETKLHDADYDIYLTRAIYYVLNRS